MLGLGIGFFLFGETVPAFWSFFNHAGFAGRLTLDEWMGIAPGGVVLAVVLMALGMFWGGEKLERIFTARRGRRADGEKGDRMVRGGEA